ncbi:xylulose kinase-1 [Tanacetum coccineum]
MSAHDDFSLHDDEELSLHDDASLAGSLPASNKGDAPAKPPQIITTNTLSNIKLPNGNSKKRVTKGKDGVYRVLPPTTQEEQFADEKERKARTLLLMAVPKDHLRRFHGMDDAKEIWAAIKTRLLMTAIKIKKFYKKTGRRPRVDGKMHVAFDKRKVECFNCHNTGHFARECKFKGSKEWFAGRSSDGEQGTVSDHSVHDDPTNTPSIEQVTIVTQKTQPQVPEPLQTVDPSCAQHVKTPRQPIRTRCLHHLFLHIKGRLNQGNAKELGSSTEELWDIKVFLIEVFWAHDWELSVKKADSWNRNLKADGEEPDESQVNTGSTLSAQVNTAEVNTAEVNTAELNAVSTPSAQVNTAEVNTAALNTGETERVQRRKGKDPMTEEDLQAEVQASKKSKELQELADLEEAQRVQAEMDVETQRQIDLDALLARRLVEQEEEAAREALATEFDYIQARLNADQILAEKIQQEEREQYSN